MTRERVGVVAAQLSDRDQAIIRDVARLQIVTGQQLRRLHYEDTESGRRQARRDLARLVEWRVVARLGRRVGGTRSGSDGFTYALDVVGQRLVDPGRRRYRPPWTPDVWFLRHAVAVSELYTSLREQSDEDQLLFYGEPASWRTFSGPGGQRLTLKPDAFITYAAEAFDDHYFIEVDRATESLPRITEKARIYVRYWQSGREQEAHDVFPLVLWIAPDEHRGDQLIEALQRLGAEHSPLFATTTGDQAAAAILGGVEPNGATS